MTARVVRLWDVTDGLTRRFEQFTDTRLVTSHPRMDPSVLAQERLCDLGHAAV